MNSIVFMKYVIGFVEVVFFIKPPQTAFQVKVTISYPDVMLELQVWMLKMCEVGTIGKISDYQPFRVQSPA